MSQERVSVVIVGAGAAGLAAASRLFERGFDPSSFIILEAENRIGGRIHTIQHGRSVIELGAQWVHGEKDNVVYPLAAAAGETLIDVYTLESTGHADNVVTAYPNANRKITRQQLDEFKQVLSDIYKASRDELANWNNSLGEYFHQRFSEKLASGALASLDRDTAWDLLDWAHRAQNLEDGSDNWFETCGVGSLQYHECEGNYTTIWKRGYSVLFDLLTRNIPKSRNGLELPLSDRIRLNSPVRLVKWDANSATTQVTCDGITYEADLVLVTCSLGVLKEDSHKLFSPALPEKKRKAIKGLGYGTVDKIFLIFKKPWWNKEWGGVSFLTDVSLVQGDWEDKLLGFYTIRNQSNVLEGWISGCAARRFESVPEDEALAKCSSLLRKAVERSSDGIGGGYEEPIGMIRTGWFTNPHFRGSYSYRSVASTERNVWASDLAEPVCDENGRVRLLFAGEATHSHHYSNVHAAVSTGWREADRIVELFKKSNGIINSKL